MKRQYFLGIIIIFLFPEVLFAAGVEYVSNELLVEYRTDVGPAVDGFFSVNAVNERRFFKVVLESESVPEAMRRLSKDPNVLSVEPNFIRKATDTTPDDTAFGAQWYHGASPGFDTVTAWDIETGDSSVVIAIIDSGVDTDHPDLVENIWVNTGEIPNNGIDDDLNGYTDDLNGYDFVDSDADPNPAPDGIDNDSANGIDSGVLHGTHVAGIAAAVGNNGLGVAGVSWDAQIMALRVLDDEGSGSDADIAEAIDYAVDNGADIINMSLGGFGGGVTLQNAVANAISNGVLVVAAAGNDGVSVNDTPYYPVCYTGVVGVGSIQSDGEASSFTNYGSDCVDLYAPGSLIYSTYYTDDALYSFTTDYGYMSGTSMATPGVVGLAGLLYSNDSTVTSTQVANILTATAVDAELSGNYTGAVLANADRALNLASCVSDEGVLTTDTIFYEDADGDGLGNVLSSQVACAANQPPGYVIDDSDLNDDDADNDGVITADDCDDTNENISELQIYYLDADGDGLGVESVTTSVCVLTAPEGYSSVSGDTDDSIVNNGIEIDGDDLDNDGDGEVDEVNKNVTHPGYKDVDPNDPDADDVSLKSVVGKKNGKVRVMIQFLCINHFRLILQRKQQY